MEYLAGGFTWQTWGVLLGAVVVFVFSVLNTADQVAKQKASSSKAEETNAALITMVQLSTAAIEKLTVLQTASAETDSAAKKLQISDEANKIEAQRREGVVGQLRTVYVLSHDGISSELMAGLAWPPADWMNEQLANLGERFTFQSDGPRVSFKDN